MKRTKLVYVNKNEDIEKKVQETLNDLLDVETIVEKDDSRLLKIQAEIQKLYDNEERVSCISDEELLAYVEKYFIYQPICNPARAGRRKLKNKGKIADSGEEKLKE